MGPVSSSISTSCARTIWASPAPCRTRACSTPSRRIRRRRFSISLLARLVLRHRLGRRDRAGARRRRDARPDQLRQHDQEGKGHRARLRARHPPVRRRLRGRGREDRARRAGRESVLPDFVRRRGRRMAAVAQVRLRAGDGGARARARACARPDRAWPLVPCRLAAAQPAHVGPGAESLGGDLPRSRRARRPALHDQSRRRLPDPLSERRAGDQDLRADDLPRAAPPFRQPHPGDDHRARPRHGRQRRRSSRPKWC